jgi:hypothetical protein
MGNFVVFEDQCLLEHDCSVSDSMDISEQCVVSVFKGWRLQDIIIYVQFSFQQFATTRKC